jgi:hypothetical protein
MLNLNLNFRLLPRGIDTMISKYEPFRQPNTSYIQGMNYNKWSMPCFFSEEASDVIFHFTAEILPVVFFIHVLVQYLCNIF